MARYCPQCGKELPEHGRFCTGCGSPIPASVRPPQHSEPTEAPPDPGVPVPVPAEGRSRGRLWALLGGAAVLLVLIAGGILWFMGSSQRSTFEERRDALLRSGIPAAEEQVRVLERLWDETGPLSFSRRSELLEQLEQLEQQSRQALESLSDHSTELARMQKEAERYDHGVSQALRDALERWEAAIVRRDTDQAEACRQEAMEALEALRQTGGQLQAQPQDVPAVESDAPAAATDAPAAATEAPSRETVPPTQPAPSSEPDPAAVYAAAEPLSISVQQVDPRSYPEMKLYLQILDRNGTVPKGLEQGFFYIDKRDANGDYIRQTVAQVTQLDQLETLNINVVADVSGSMDGRPLAEAKQVMESFIMSVQFHAGDLVELTSFSTGVYINEEFCNDRDLLISDVRSLQTDNMTSLYDALYTAVNRVASQSGAKCVMAFTDGMDNYSSCTGSQVIALAQRYNVPIFIIGIGSVDVTELRSICAQTGGTYYDVGAIRDMQEIYQQIYRREKELYMVTYTDLSGSGATERSDLSVGYRSQSWEGSCTYTYEPRILLRVEDDQFYQTGPEAVVEKYIKGYAFAQTESDFSYIEPYLKPGSQIYNDQKQFVQQSFSVFLDSFEIDSVEYSSSTECIVTTYETYFVQPQSSPLYLMTQRCRYCLTDTGTGWLLTAFAEPVEVISKINQ